METDIQTPQQALDDLEKKNERGIYHILLKNDNAFMNVNPQFHAELEQRGFPLTIYVGKAASAGGLRRRLREDLRQTGRSTFFRSIGALIGAIPDKGTQDPTNYMFSGTEKDKCISFINENVEIFYIFLERKNAQKISELEKSDIREIQPILNIQENPNPSLVLQEARRNCREIAGQESGDKNEK